MFFPDKYDPVWHLREQGFNPDHVQYYESIFALGNGYLGTRGSLEEKVRNSAPATLVAGLYDKAPKEVTELANIANWLGVELSIDGEVVGLEQSRILEHERILDLQAGILYRKSLFQLRSNRKIQIISRRFVSIADVHLMGMDYSFRVEDSHATSLKLVMRSGLDGSVTNEGRAHFSVPACGPLDENGLFLVQKGQHSDHEVALASRLRVMKGEGVPPDRIAVKKEPNHIMAELTLDVETNVQYTLDKLVAIYSTRESRDPKTAAIEKLKDARRTSFALHLDAHAREWARRWENSDIAIQGDDFAQIAVRMSIFHLLQAASESDDRVSIPAKALTGFGYKGHVFWDTDVFILPFFNMTNPLLSRNMLTYRYHTLREAKKRAKQKGYEGRYSPGRAPTQGRKRPRNSSNT